MVGGLPWWLGRCWASFGPADFLTKPIYNYFTFISIVLCLFLAAADLAMYFLEAQEPNPIITKQNCLNHRGFEYRGIFQERNPHNI